MAATAIEQTVMQAADGSWEVRSVAPGADLAGLVLGYQGYIERGGPTFRQRQVTTSVIPIIVNLGPAFRVASVGTGAQPQDFGSFVAGLDSGHAAVAATGASLCMQVDLTPPGAYGLFGLPMSALAGHVVSLDDVLGAAAARLRDHLDATADWSARFAILDRFVRDRLERAPAVSAPVLWAWRQLVSSHGRIRIVRLADDLGWSRKHLAARFTAEIGRPPKIVARILRFERLNTLMDRAAAPDWAELAYACGYADQAHMIREFRHFAGTTPRSYLGEDRLLS